MMSHLHCDVKSVLLSCIPGNKPPGLVPNKFLYMTTDLHRLAQYFQVPISPPADPFEAMFEKGAPPCMSFM